jgi:SAM-dependent methyltransferase
MSEHGRRKAEQLAYWNGPGADHWVARQTHTDVTLAPVLAATLDFAAPRAGEHVLDIGCGCGASTLALADVVGEGRVLGVDISAPMLATGRARAEATSIGNIDWHEADAATAPLPEDAYDLLFSRFGVMFFADPAAAFANLRRAVRPDGRLAFVCWRGIEENPWMQVPLHAVYKHVPRQPRPGPEEPGPFAFADAARVTRIFADAGWARPRLEKLDLMLDVAAGRGLDAAVEQATQIGAASRALRDQPEDAVAAAVVSVRETLAQHAEGDSVRLAGAMWLVEVRPA